MIVMHVSGGLGNQLFQYAAGLSLALRHGTSLRLHVDWYRTQTLRTLMLDRFRMHIETATADDLAFFAGPRSWSPRLWMKRVGAACRPGSRPVRYFEDGLGFNAAFDRLPRNAYLYGGWASERYFRSCAARVRELYRPARSLSAYSRAMLDRIEASPCAVSVHARRGDKARDPDTARLHGTCGVEYYQRALARLPADPPDKTFFVFSDEPDWCRDHLRLPGTVVPVDGNVSDRPEEDLHLMSRCRHHVIANSTFSWWGAWLATAADRCVIAPRRWFNELALDMADLLPPSWIRL